MDTWATSSLTPQIVGGWHGDDDLFGRVFPMDLRPQAHEIIRTWLFATVVRSRAEHGVLPWHTANISGWVVAPGHEKISKSKGNSTVGPSELIDRYGADAVRYWSACGRPGVDLVLNENQMKVGRRLATKILNASRFVLGLSPVDTGVEEPLDHSMLARLSTVVANATQSLVDYDHTGALIATEAFFWEFCDDYIELVKNRAYTGDPSARAALGRALDVQLRLFAPFLPYVTEEVWSWWRTGSIHRAPWPTPEGQPTGDPAVLADVSAALAAIRKAKSSRSLSMRAEVAVARIEAPAETAERLRAAEGDLRAAAHIIKLEYAPAPALTVTCAFA
jgi:valyl-tRNA synthetase